MITPEGEQLGVIAIERALEEAQKRNLDLVEVAPEANPPVCKIMDYARKTFEAKRRMKESRKKAKAVEIKEIKLRPKIDPHDYGIKTKQVRQFLEKGAKVKVTMRYRPYEMRHYEQGTEVLQRVVDDMIELAEVDNSPRAPDRGRVQSIMLAPKK